MSQRNSSRVSRFSRPSIPVQRRASSTTTGTTAKTNDKKENKVEKFNVSKDSLVSVKERDFLEQDPPIRGQEFVCISFVSPEDEIQNREIFEFFEFTKNFSNDIGMLMDNLGKSFEEKEDLASIDMLKALRERYDYLFNSKALGQQYKYFKEVNNSRLEKEYNEKNDFRTNIRGIKVRGVYSNIEEAKARAVYLKKVDPKSPDIFIGQVGCWCPWSPYADEIQDQEYSETALNTLMKKYKENEEERNQHYQLRKEYMEKQLDEEKKQILAENEKLEQKTENSDNNLELNTTNDLAHQEPNKDKIFEQDDPWMNKKMKMSNHLTCKVE